MTQVADQRALSGVAQEAATRLRAALAEIA
jgi:hypothetical protein